MNYELSEEKFTTLARIETCEKEACERGFNVFIETDLNNGLQSNFRAVSILTDPDRVNERALAIKKRVRKVLDDKSMHPRKVLMNLEQINIDVEKLIDHLLDLNTQVNFTGRCLNGALNPNASVHTDQRPHSKEMLEFFMNVAKENI